MVSYFTLEESGAFPKERLEMALKFLKDTDLNSMETGKRVHIDGDNLFAEAYEYETMAEEKTMGFETHDIYADVHYLVSGTELVGVVKREELTEREKYDSSKDITFYNMPEKYFFAPIYPGSCVLVTPNMGHMPKVQMEKPCVVKKVVVKIKMI